MTLSFAQKQSLFFSRVGFAEVLGTVGEQGRSPVTDMTYALILGNEVCRADEQRPKQGLNLAVRKC